MKKTIAIPDYYFENGQPYLTDYNGNPNEGLCYVPPHETRFGLASAYGGTVDSQRLVTSLLSPKVIGWKHQASQWRLVSVNLKRRKVVIEKK